MIKNNQSTVVFGSEKVSGKTYTSLAKDSFSEIPSTFERAKPVKTRQDATKEQYKLGENKIPQYQTAHMGQFAVPAETAQLSQKEEIRFVNRNKRIDIITGEILNNNYKNSGYEAYTEGSQARISGNKSYMPQDLYVACPITGRRIIKK